MRIVRVSLSNQEKAGTDMYRSGVSCTWLRAARMAETAERAAT